MGKYGYMEQIDEIMRPFVTPQNYVRRRVRVFNYQAEIVYNPDLTDAELLSRLIAEFDTKKADGIDKQISASDIVESVVAVAEIKIESEVEKTY